MSDSDEPQVKTNPFENPHADPLPKSPDEALPPVKAPSAGFLLQLFLIPMIIVTIIVMICLLFNWLAHMGSDPRDLARGLRGRLNEASWQKAFTLTNLLRDPKHAYLKKDAELAGQLAEVLEEELEAGKLDKSRLRLRIFLSRALGEFQVERPLPTLLRAARLQRDEQEIQVRLAALEAIAVLADNLRKGDVEAAIALQKNTELMTTLIEATRERQGGAEQRHAVGELRSAAAFALGVVGGAEALDRLHVVLTNDPHPNARFNAANGMARHGDARCLPVLEEMLDPDNERTVQGETSDSERLRKRMLVLMNAIRATRRLAEANSDVDLSKAKTQLERLQQSSLPKQLRVEAKAALIALRKSGR